MKQRTAIITGASRGIGRAIATVLAQNGYQLILTCQKNEALLFRLKEELEQQYSISCRALISDAGYERSVTKLFEQIDDLDILINNAGISYVGLLHEMELDQWNQVMTTNLTSAFLYSKYAIPLMLKKKSGKIINISSVWGNVGASTEVAYSASKGGMNAFTKALAKELAPSCIQVNAIACGMIDTDMNHNLTPDEVRSCIDEIPADRIGQPEDVASAVLALCSCSDYLTGQIITVDGGWI